MNCDPYRHQLLDLAYGENVRTPELEEHLATCAACRAYSANILEVQEQLGPFILPEEPGFREVKAALREAHRQIERRNLILDLGKFAGVLMVVFSLYYAVYDWQGLKGFAIFYFTLYWLLPLVLIPLQRWVGAKGDAE